MFFKFVKFVKKRARKLMDGLREDTLNWDTL